jgi:hypothetical protein
VIKEFTIVKDLRIDEGMFTVYCCMLSLGQLIAPLLNFGGNSASLNQLVDPSAEEASSTLVA